MTGSGGNEPQSDLLSGISDLDAFRHLLADLHDDLPGKVTRFRHLADLGGALGSQGTMLFGVAATFNAWTEARSSFVHGNFAATILLCQSLVENLRAAVLHASLMKEDLPPRIAFRDTLKRCQDRNLISGQDDPCRVTVETANGKWQVWRCDAVCFHERLTNPVRYWEGFFEPAHF